MNTRVFWIYAMECICAQTRPWFILSSERVLRNGVRNFVNFKGKIPSTGGSEEIRTCDAASHRTASQTHYPLNYSSPSCCSSPWWVKASNRNMLCMYHTWRWTVATYTVATSTAETCSECTIADDRLWQPTLWLSTSTTETCSACTIPEDGLRPPTLWHVPYLKMDCDNQHCDMYHTWRWTVTTYTVTCTIPEDGLWPPTLWHVPYLKMDCDNQHCDMYHTWRSTVTTYTVAFYIYNRNMLSMYHTWRWTVTTYTVATSTAETCSECTIADDRLWQPTLWLHLQQKHAQHVPYLKMDCDNLHCGMYHTWRWTVATYTVPTSTTETCSACTIPEDGLWPPTLWHVPYLKMDCDNLHCDMYHTWRWTVTTYTVTCTIPEDGLWPPTLWHVPYLKMDCDNQHCDMYHTWRWTVTTYTVPTSTTETCSACTTPEDGLWQPTLWLHLQ